MSRSACFRRIIIFLIAFAAAASAHQIPSLTVETEFREDRSFTVKVNLDPRLFLSQTPAEIPPVPVEWYLDQSEAQLVETRSQAQAYLSRALTLIFSGKTAAPLSYTFLPMDGATNMPLEAETREVHLLAQATSRLADDAVDFKAALSKDAAVSMILLNNLAGTPERRPQVLFPGETGRPFSLATLAAPPSPPVAEPPKPPPVKEVPAVKSATAETAKPADGGAIPWGKVSLIGALLVAVLGVRWLVAGRK